MLRLTMSVLLAAMVAAPAAAQSTAETARRDAISAGAHWALPYSERFAKPGVQLSWRHWFRPNVGIGADFRWWHQHTTEDINFPAQTGPGDVAIRSQHGRDEHWMSSYGLGVGILARRSSGRLSLVGGAGLGFFADRSISDIRINGAHDTGRIALHSVGVHMLAELEVRATSRLSGFVGVRLEQRDVRFVESGSGYPTAGVRFAF